MRILAFEGISPVSWAIRLQTLCNTSHVAWETRAGTVIEAVPWHGVVCSDDPWRYHTPGTKIKVFDFASPLTDEEGRVALRWLLKQVGKKYDYRGVIRLVTRVPHPENDKWFCSELVSAVCREIARPISRLPDHHVIPRDIVVSPKLICMGEL